MDSAPRGASKGAEKLMHGHKYNSEERHCIPDVRNGNLEEVTLI